MYSVSLTRCSICLSSSLSVRTQGFISIETPDGSEKHQVVYQGVAASMSADYPIFDLSTDYFGFPLPAIVDAFGDHQVGPATYTL